ncbi:MAG TPA: hypothetical protein VGO00_26550 [Kofleriaceae bacterium]|nr:hypothetical protein [Kofleriaceae bacterium]
MLCAVLPGCFASKSKPTRYAADSAVVAGGAAMWIKSSLETCSDAVGFSQAFGCSLNKQLGSEFGPVLIAAGVLLLVHTWFYDPNAVDAPEVPTPPPPPTKIPDAASIPAPATANPELRQLTLEASVAARVGQCAAVQTIARRVETIDVEYREHGFASDARVASCLP